MTIFLLVLLSVSIFSVAVNICIGRHLPVAAVLKNRRKKTLEEIEAYTRYLEAKAVVGTENWINDTQRFIEETDKILNRQYFDYPSRPKTVTESIERNRIEQERMSLQSYTMKSSDVIGRATPVQSPQYISKCPVCWGKAKVFKLLSGNLVHLTCSDCGYDGYFT